MCDWSSDVCSSDLVSPERIQRGIRINERKALIRACYKATLNPGRKAGHTERRDKMMEPAGGPVIAPDKRPFDVEQRSEEHTSELQSLMRNSYAVFCLKQQKTIHTYQQNKYSKPTQ